MEQDLEDLALIVEKMRELGVFKYKNDSMEVELGPKPSGKYIPEEKNEESPKKTLRELRGQTG